ncbi:hypothetical protein CC80DRAFT_180441, partial [Byssothecium circinans]
ASHVTGSFVLQNLDTESRFLGRAVALSLSPTHEAPGLTRYRTLSAVMDKDRFIRSLSSPEECDICYEAYDLDHVAVRLPCGHWFGITCITANIENAPSPDACPKCRSQMYGREQTLPNLTVAPIPLPRPLRLPLALPRPTPTPTPHELWVPLWRIVSGLSSNYAHSLVQATWGIVRQHGPPGPNASSSAREYHINAVLMHLAAKVESIQGTNFSSDVVRYIKLVATDPDIWHPDRNHPRYPHAVRRLRAEPLRNLVFLMMDVFDVGFDPTMPGRVAHLFWNFNLLVSRPPRAVNVDVTREQELTALRFLIVAENAEIMINPVSNSNRPLRHYRMLKRWKVVDDWLGYSTNVDFMAYVQTEIADLQQAQGTLGIPYLTGQDSEEDAVQATRDLWRKNTACLW